jgi:hypothetical protein
MTMSRCASRRDRASERRRTGYAVAVRASGAASPARIASLRSGFPWPGGGQGDLGHEPPLGFRDLRDDEIGVAGRGGEQVRAVGVEQSRPSAVRMTLARLWSSGPHQGSFSPGLFVDPVYDVNEVDHLRGSGGDRPVERDGLLVSL